MAGSRCAEMGIVVAFKVGAVMNHVIRLIIVMVSDFLIVRHLVSSVTSVP